MNDVKMSVFKPGDGRKFYYVEFVDPRDGNTKRVSLKTTKKREADQKAGVIRRDLAEGSWSKKVRTPWKEFRQQYLNESTLGLKASSIRDIGVTLNRLEAVCKPKTVQAVNGAMLQTFTTKVIAAARKKAGDKVTQSTGITTLSKHLRNLRKMLRWATRKGMFATCPHVDMPKGSSKGKSKGRPVTVKEFPRMLQRTAKEVGETQADSWKFLLRGLFLGGLRLNEAITLSWDTDAEDVISVDMSGQYPMFAIPADADKSRKRRLLPMVPEFAHLLETIPDDERIGNVFRLKFRRDHGMQTRCDTVTKQISAIGKAAGIRVSASKYASAHDLRRSFGSRWADKVKPHILMQLMRHDDIKTTMEFYVQSDADEVAEAVWLAAATDTSEQMQE
ncbi:MAG: site-specific integrase [Fuerstiella sp.]